MCAKSLAATGPTSSSTESRRAKAKSTRFNSDLCLPKSHFSSLFQISPFRKTPESRKETKRRCRAPPYKTNLATTANYMLFSKCRFFVRSFFLFAQSKHLQQGVSAWRRVLLGLLGLRRRNFVAASGANVLVRLNSKLTTRTQVIKHFSRPLSLIRV